MAILKTSVSIFQFNFPHPTQARSNSPPLGRPYPSNSPLPGTENSQMPPGGGGSWSFDLNGALLDEGLTLDKKIWRQDARCQVRNGREVGSLSFSWREVEIIDFTGREMGIDDDNALEYFTNPWRKTSLVVYFSVFSILSEVSSLEIFINPMSAHLMFTHDRNDNIQYRSKLLNP